MTIFFNWLNHISEGHSKTLSLQNPNTYMNPIICLCVYLTSPLMLSVYVLDINAINMQYNINYDIQYCMYIYIFNKSGKWVIYRVMYCFFYGTISWLYILSSEQNTPLHVIENYKMQFEDMCLYCLLVIVLEMFLPLLNESHQDTQKIINWNWFIMNLCQKNLKSKQTNIFPENTNKHYL